jgi:hypothetical protein
MAVVETIRIEGDTSGIENKIQKLNKSIENLVDTVEDVGSESKKSFDKMDKESAETTKAVKKTDGTLKGFIKNIKGAAKAAAAIAVVRAAFLQTQVAVDAVNTAMNTLTIAINNFQSLFSGGIIQGLKTAFELGKQLTKLEKEALLADVERQKVQLENQKLAEQERQDRDDITKSINDRIAANENIAKILDDQITKEKALIDQQVIAAQARFDASGKIEDQIVLRQKQLQQIELEERTTSVESERLANKNALITEQNSLREQQNINDAEAIRLGLEIIRVNKKSQETDVLLEEVPVGSKETFANTYIGRLKEQAHFAERSMQLLINFNNKRIEEEEKAGNTENAEYEALLRNKLDLEAQYNEESLAFQNEIFQARADNIVGGFDLASQGAQAFADLNDALSAGDQANAEQAFKRTKALQLAGAIANTAAAVTAQLAVPQDALTGANFVKAGIALTTGLAQIATIKSTKFEQEATTLPTTTVSAPTQPAQFNIVGQSGTNQLLEGIAGTFDRPVRAYVVSGEVLSGSQLDRQRLRTATFP